MHKVLVGSFHVPAGLIMSGEWTLDGEARSILVELDEPINGYDALLCLDGDPAGYSWMVRLVDPEGGRQWFSEESFVDRFEFIRDVWTAARKAMEDAGVVEKILPPNA